MNLPITINGFGSPITIRETNLGEDGPFGYFDERTGEIVVSENLSEFGKHAIVIHELLHLTATILKQSKVIKRQPDEEFIVNASSQLAAFMACAGLLAGVTASDVFAEIEVVQ